MKYHVNIKTGKSGVCRATKQGCPLGEGTPHFENETGAKRFIEEMAKSENNVFTRMSKVKNNSSTVASPTPVVAKKNPYRNSEVMGATPENRVTDDVVKDFGNFSRNFNSYSKGSEGKESARIRQVSQEIFSLNGVNKDSISQLESRVKNFNADNHNDLMMPNHTKEARETIGARINATEKALSEIKNLKANIKDPNVVDAKFDDSTLHEIETFRNEIPRIANYDERLNDLPDGGKGVVDAINGMYESNMRFDGVNRDSLSNFVEDLQSEANRLYAKSDYEYDNKDVDEYKFEIEASFISEVADRFNDFLK